MTGDKWLDAQYSVLGSVLISPEVVPQVLQETRETDFEGACRTVYKVIRDLFLAGQPVDPVAVAGKLGQDYRQFLVQLMEITPTAANVGYYLKLTREQSRAAQLRELGKQMAAETDLDKLQSLMAQANGATMDRPSVRVYTMGELLQRFYQRQTTKAEYLSWPIQELDYWLYAEPGDFIVFGGRPSSGKTAWTLQCARHWAKRYKVGFFSLETNEDKITDRFVSSAAQISMRDIKRRTIGAADSEHLCQIAGSLAETAVEIIPAAGMTVADIRAVTMMHGYQLIIVDYLQLIIGRGGSRTEEVTGISIGLHTMAQSLGVTVVALSQLSRPEDKKGSRAPDMDSLRESGQIEQDADIVMMLNEAKDSTDRELWVRKNKEGTCFQARLAFDGDHQTFSKALNQEAQAELDKFKHARKKPLPTPVAAKEDYQQLPVDTPVPF